VGKAGLTPVDPNKLVVLANYDNFAVVFLSLQNGATDVALFLL
jgi:hypothetical protein